MPRAYSVDLRERAVRAVLEGKGSVAAVARQFEISDQTLRLWLRQYEATGSLEPGVPPGAEPLLDANDLEALVKLCEQHIDATLDELCQYLQDATGKSIGRSTMHDYLQRLGISRKKKFPAAGAKRSGDSG